MHRRPSPTNSSLATLPASTTSISSQACAPSLGHTVFFDHEESTNSFVALWCRKAAVLSPSSVLADSWLCSEAESGYCKQALRLCGSDTTFCSWCVGEEATLHVSFSNVLWSG